MATFKPGMRVRIVRCHNHPQIAGKEAVIVRRGTCAPEHWVLSVDGVGETGPDLTGFVCALSADTHELSPLTPPAQDEWAADQVRKVTKPVYTEPERVKERA